MVQKSNVLTVFRHTNSWKSDVFGPCFCTSSPKKRKNSPITSFHQLRVHINEWNHGCLPQISKELRCACRRLSWKNFWNKNWCLLDCYSLKKCQSFYSRFWFKRFPQHWMRITTIFGEFPKNCEVRCGFTELLHASKWSPGFWKKHHQSPRKAE